MGAYDRHLRRVENHLLKADGVLAARAQLKRDRLVCEVDVIQGSALTHDDLHHHCVRGLREEDVPDLFVVCLIDDRVIRRAA